MITLHYLYRTGDCGDGCCSWDESTIVHDGYGYPDDVDTCRNVGAISNKAELEEWCNKHDDRLWWIFNQNPNESMPHDWNWRTEYEINESMCEWC